MGDFGLGMTWAWPMAKTQLEQHQWWWKMVRQQQKKIGMSTRNGEIATKGTLETP